MPETAAAKRKRLKLARRGYRLKSVYGITLDEYALLLKKQHNKCAICKGSRPYYLHIDHDHAVESVEGSRASVRGLLCKRCNQLLRAAQDSPSLLRAAARYLGHWPSKGVIECTS